MKTVFVYIIICICFSATNLFAQVDLIGHTTGNSAFYAGWSNTVTFPFDIRHDAAQRIRLFTNGSSTTTNLRMLIEPNKTITYQGVNLNIGGFIGMGTTNWWNANRT